MNKFIAFCGLVLLLLSGCAVPRMKGVNYLQTGTVAMDDARSHASLLRLKALGANTVAFVPFLQQDAPGSVGVRFADNVTVGQLTAGIRDAKALGFRVALKPQILVKGDWAGGIKMPEASAWARWFSNYERALAQYAELAEKERVDILVIGTELNNAAPLPLWRPLIAQMRLRYRGKLTYAAHNVEGIGRFAHWDLLDGISVTLYPSLGDSPERAAMKTHIRKTVAELKEAGRKYDKPLWIAEVGIASRQSAQKKPWEWQGAELHERPADEGLQAEVLELWLDALNGRWNDGVLLWCWNSDPDSGGPQDT
ncbi:MAG TPA: hypothetical protein VGB23_00890, partial [Nitrospirota bacterium]